MEITWIRHGLTLGNKEKRYIGTTEEDLCEEGIASLELKCRQGDYPKVQTLYCSPMIRCKSTAKLIYPQINAINMDGLKECDFGLFEGKNYLELTDRTEYQNWINSGGTEPFPGGESIEEFKERCCQTFLSIVEQEIDSKTEYCSIIAHGGTIMSVMERYCTCGKSYYSWYLDNAAFYTVWLDDLEWSRGEKRYVLVHS